MGPKFLNFELTIFLARTLTNAHVIFSRICTNSELHYSLSLIPSSRNQSHFDAVVLRVRLGVDLPQQKTELFAGSHFKRTRKVGAYTPTIQDVHRLFPADGFPHLIHKLMSDAVDGPVPQRRCIGVNRDDWFTQFGSTDGTCHRRQRRMHQPCVERARRRQPVDLPNPKLSTIFLDKFQCLRQTAALC